MHKSKLIQFIQIDDGTGRKYQIDNEEYETLVKKITEQIFENEKIKLNKSILLGLIYDSKLRSSTEIEMLDYHFVRQYTFGDTISFSKGSHDAFFKTMYEFKKLMKKCKELLQMDETVSYEDLAIAYLGSDAFQYNLIMVDEIKNMKFEDVIETIKSCLKIKSANKNLTVDTIRRVVALAGRKYNVQNLSLIGEVVGPNRLYLDECIRLFSTEKIYAPISAIPNTLQLIERCLDRTVTFDEVESSKIVNVMTDAFARSEEIIEIN